MIRKTVASYAFGPFSLTSDLPLPELSLAESSSVSDRMPVQITVGAVPETILEPTFQTTSISASRDELLLHIEGVASYYIRQGTEVTVDPCPGSDELDVRGYLLGNILAILCHQRRLLPLHASAVRIGSGAVAFLGDSGAGKSTLAAFLVARGFSLVADDVCLLDPDAEPARRVLPVAPWLKLWRNSLEVLGQGKEGLARTFTDEDKYRVPASNLATVEVSPLPLAGLVFLRRGEQDSKTVLVSLTPAQSVMEAMRYTYQQYLLGWLGLQEEHFARSSRAISGARVFSCYRPWGFAELETVAAQLEAKFGSPTAAAEG